MKGPSILCLGNDLALLQTRKLVLETQFDVKHCSNAKEAIQLWPACPFELLVLCHTLSDEECAAAEAYADSRTPAAHLLALQAGRSAFSKRARILRNLDGPEPLLNAVRELLRCSEN